MAGKGGGYYSKKQKGQYDVCLQCSAWAWRSRWTPKCKWCDLEWGHKPAGDLQPNTTIEDKPDPLAKLAQQDAEAVRELAQRLGSIFKVDMLDLLVNHLPAAAPPPVVEDDEEGTKKKLYYQLRDAHNKLAKTEVQATRAQKEVDDKQSKLDAAKEKATKAKTEHEQAKATLEEVRAKYFAHVPLHEQKRFAREAGLEGEGPPKEDPALLAFPDFDDEDAMEDAENEEQKALAEERKAIHKAEEKIKADLHAATEEENLLKARKKEWVNKTQKGFKRGDKRTEKAAEGAGQQQEAKRQAVDDGAGVPRSVGSGNPAASAGSASEPQPGV